METKVLYQFSLQFHYNDLLTLFIVMFLFLLLYFAYNSERKWIKYPICAVLILILIVTIYAFIILPIKSYFWAKKHFDNGQYSIVEGYVHDYLPSSTNAIWGHSSESFSIDGVSFHYYGTEPYGYSIFKSDGGIIEEGQKLRIYYLYDPFYNESIICYIEELELE